MKRSPFYSWAQSYFSRDRFDSDTASAARLRNSRGHSFHTEADTHSMYRAVSHHGKRGGETNGNFWGMEAVAVLGTGEASTAHK